MKLYSPITKTSSLITVGVTGEVISSAQCPVTPVYTLSWKTLWSSLFGESSTWLISYTIMIATVILILVIYHLYTKGRQPAPVVISSSPYHLVQQSPPPYQYSPTYNSPRHTPGSYGPGKQATPQRTLFSVSQ